MGRNIKILSGGSNFPLVKEISSFLGIDIVNAIVNCFPDGETYVQINENIRGSDVFIVQSTCQPANQNVMELLIMIDAVKRASADRITAVIPFFGYARQDRKDKPRVPITSKLVANLLTAAGADRVLTMDLHSPQITGFFDIPVDHLSASPVFFEYLKELVDDNWVIVSPDAGGFKLASAYANILGCDLGMVAKRRTDAENVEPLYIIGEVQGKHTLILDDMTESGGTLVAAAQTLKKAGATSVRAAVSHGVLNQKGYERLSAQNDIEELITTNSTPVKENGLPIRVLGVGKMFGEAIMRIHHNESVSSLFEIKGV